MNKLEVIHDSILNKTSLCVSVYSWRLQTSSHPLYMISLLDLEPSELLLNSGRFKRYITNPPDTWTNVPTYFSGSRDIIEDKFNSIINWMGSHCKCMWGLIPITHSVNNFEQIWRFEDVNDAIMFKLKWC